jgi:hypothetical protein
MPGRAGRKRLYVVRYYDGLRNQWSDVSSPVTMRNAKRIWDRKTNGGTQNTKFADLAYYKIFPADEDMVFSGGVGQIPAVDEPETAFSW